MCVALLAYGREELHHGKPETDVYEMKAETLVEPDFKEAFLDVSLISVKFIFFIQSNALCAFPHSAGVHYESAPFL